jgi:hypothetical protein
MTESFFSENFTSRHGARVTARWGAIACSEHDRVVDLRPVAIWWPFMLDLPKVLRHLGRCPCHRHDAQRCWNECASRGEGCERGPLTQLEVERLLEAVGKYRDAMADAGSREAILDLARRLTVDGVPLDHLVDVVFLLAANGYEEAQ